MHTRGSAYIDLGGISVNIQLGRPRRKLDVAGARVDDRCLRIIVLTQAEIG